MAGRHATTYYGTTWGEGGAFFIYPPLARAHPGPIPWEPFIVIWMTLLFTAFWAATRWWSLPVRPPSVGVASLLTGFQGPVSDPIAFTVIGNPQVLVGLICVIGFRYPAAWAFVFLTKIAPGIGVLWFAFRREWRPFWIAIGVTSTIALVSVVLGPAAWMDFGRFAFANANTASPVPLVPIPFVVRILDVAGALMVGRPTDRRWTMPIAVGWSSLALYQRSYGGMDRGAPLAFGPRHRSGTAGSTDPVASATISRTRCYPRVDDYAHTRSGACLFGGGPHSSHRLVRRPTSSARSDGHSRPSTD